MANQFDKKGTNDHIEKYMAWRKSLNIDSLIVGDSSDY